MEAYSEDLRERVVAAVDRKEGTQIQIARRFGVTDRWIRKIAAAATRQRFDSTQAARRGTPGEVFGAKTHRMRRYGWGPRGQRVREATRSIEREAILEALRSTKGNVTQAARALGLSRRGLQLKMKELEIDRA